MVELFDKTDAWDTIDVFDLHYYNTSDNSIEVIGNLTVVHISDVNSNYSNFPYVVLTGSGHDLVILEGKDVTMLKRMASSVKFYN